MTKEMDRLAHLKEQIDAGIYRPDLDRLSLILEPILFPSTYSLRGVKRGGKTK